MDIAGAANSAAAGGTSTVDDMLRRDLKRAGAALAWLRAYCGCFANKRLVRLWNGHQDIIRFVGNSPTNLRAPSVPPFAWERATNVEARFVWNFPTNCIGNPVKEVPALLAPMLLVRMSYQDLLLAWEVVDHTARVGRGGIRYCAARRGISPTLVMAALDRVERAFGGRPFLAAGARRMGRLTEAGTLFHVRGIKLIVSWQTAVGWRPNEFEDYDPAIDEW